MRLNVNFIVFEKKKVRLFFNKQIIHKIFLEKFLSTIKQFLNQTNKLSIKIMSVTAIHSLSLLKQTLSSISQQMNSKFGRCGNASSRYEQVKPMNSNANPNVNGNGLYSERSSSCYNAIKKKRMLREGRSKSHLKAIMREQIATIDVGARNSLVENYQRIGMESEKDVSLGHCIDHLDSIIQLLKNQKYTKQQNNKKQTIEIGIKTIEENIKLTGVESVTEQKKKETIRQDMFIKKNVIEKQKRYRTVSHSENRSKVESETAITLQPRQSLMLRFSKKKSEQQAHEIKPLITKIINETKRQSKTLRLKEIRDKYKHLSKSKSTQNYEIASKVNVQTLNNDSNRKYGRRMMRVCSSGNYQIETNNKSKEMALIADKKIKNAMRYDIKQDQQEQKTSKKDNLLQKNKQQNQSKEQDVQLLNTKPTALQFLPLKQDQQKMNPSVCKQKLLNQKQNLIQQVSEKSSMGFELKDISCSKIHPRRLSSQTQNKSLNSFFSQIPSYLDSTKQYKSNKIKAKESNADQKLVKPFNLSNNEEGNVLNLLDADSIEIKQIFKAKEKRKQLQKWKRNFPEGFFEVPKV